jgi:hypothetical protein
VEAVERWQRAGAARRGGGRRRRVPALRGAAVRAGGAAVRAGAARGQAGHGGGVPGAGQPRRGAPAAEAPGLLQRPGLRVHRRRVFVHLHRQQPHRHHYGRPVMRERDSPRSVNSAIEEMLVLGPGW